MFYGEHLAVAGKQISSSNFCVLVDAAVMLYEEERDKRIFHLFPRKRRSFSYTRMRNPQQTHENRNGASTSSSPLLDLNSILPADDVVITYQPPLWLSSSYSLFLGDYKFKNPPNPNPPPLPSSCLKTEKTSLKRRAPQVIKPSGKAKKAKVASLSWKGRETPERLLQLMRDMEGIEPRLIFEKTLSETDCDPAQSRLLMPFNSLIRNDFLTSVESRLVDMNNDDNTGVGSILVDQLGVKWGVIFKRRDMKKKDSGKVNLNYAFICGWNDMVKSNGLKDGDSITVWSFRWHQLLCFAIVPPP